MIGLPNLDNYEESIIGIVLIDANAWERVSNRLKYPECFQNTACRSIYHLMLKYKKEKGDTAPIDVTTLGTYAEQNEDYGVSRSAIAEYATGVVTAANLDYLIQEVFDNYTKRMMKTTLADLHSQIGTDISVFDSLQMLHQVFADMRVDYEKTRPSIPLSDYLTEKQKRDSERQPGKLLGYGSNQFHKLAKHIDGIQPGFYIIAADTNKGKTAFLTNLCLDLLITNPHTSVVYFSLDDSKDVIINRLLSIMTGMPINEVQRPQKDNRQQKLYDSYEKLRHLASEGRIDIKDQGEITQINALELSVIDKTNDNLVVMIDGLYNLDVGRTTGHLREQNIDRANKIKALVDKYQIPIIVTGELRKRTANEKPETPPTIDRLMETGKFAYNANLVWLLYPENWESFDNDDEPTLLLRFAKNKLSYFKGIQKIKFIRETGKMELTI